MRFVVTGGAGFIGSHLVDRLIVLGHEVDVIDNLLSGCRANINTQARFHERDITDITQISDIIAGADGVYHLAAIARTPWCIDDPLLCYKTNVLGSLNVLEAARQGGVHRVVMTSSNVVYAFMTPYRSSKEALEGIAKVYTDMYGLSVVCLRNSNVYGQRQSELGPSPNVFSALRKAKREQGKLLITGDGLQSRDFTHVSDIVTGHILAMAKPEVTGVYDLCTGVNHTLNEVATYFNAPIEYIAERPGDVKHIIQDPKPAQEALAWQATMTLAEGIQDFLADTDYMH